MNKKPISIIIPCYQVEPYIDRCIQSLVSQTIGISNLELIFVNDASTDGTLDKLWEYQKKYPDSMLVIDCNENKRQGGARNIGLSYASGDYIGFVDSDDWVEKTMYQRLYEKAITYDCDIVFCRHTRDKCDTDHIQPDRRTKKEDVMFEISDAAQREEFIASSIIGVGVWDKLYKRSIIFEHEIRFPERLAYEDILWGAMFYLYAKRIYIVEENLYHYFVNEASTVLKMDEEYHLDMLTVNLMKWQEYIERGATAAYKEAVEFDFITTYYLAGLKMLFLRFKKVPYQTFREMQMKVTELIPGCLHNKYLKKHLSDFYLLLAETIDKDISEKEINQMSDLMKKLV